MKHLLFSIIALLFMQVCVAQQVIDRKKSLTSMVIEKYHTVIETNKEVKQGQYQAFYNKQTPIASGEYTEDKRIGVWHFFDPEGKVLEHFNYDTNTLQYEAPEDSTSYMRYVFDDKFKATDRVTKPIKIGGRYYGYVPYLRQFKLPADMEGINHIQYVAVLELLITPLGRLAEYKIHLKSATYEKVVNINPDVFSDADKTFVPATLNGEQVSCRIFIQCYLNEFDEIDMR